jgi:hypothetical protein
VKPETALIRPYVVAAVLRGVTLDASRYNSFIDLQVCLGRLYPGFLYLLLLCIAESVRKVASGWVFLLHNSIFVCFLPP